MKKKNITLFSSSRPRKKRLKIHLRIDSGVLRSFIDGQLITDIEPATRWVWGGAATVQYNSNLVLI